MDYVVNQIYDLLPLPLQIIPKSAYKKIIQILTTTDRTAFTETYIEIEYTKTTD